MCRWVNVCLNGEWTFIFWLLVSCHIDLNYNTIYSQFAILVSHLWTRNWWPFRSIRIQPRFLVGVRVARSSVFCEMFCGFFVFLSFCFCHSAVCPSITASDYPFGSNNNIFSFSIFHIATHVKHSSSELWQNGTLGVHL
jgi:hypothetical protein